jgi:hypothetical protein
MGPIAKRARQVTRGRNAGKNDHGICQAALMTYSNGRPSAPALPLYGHDVDPGVIAMVAMLG